jgi:hypothetical protein
MHYIKYLVSKVRLAEVDDAASIAEERISRPFSCQHLHQDYAKAVHVCRS